MERVTEMLISEYSTNASNSANASNSGSRGYKENSKRFAYLGDIYADNPILDAYCRLVIALARKDVQLIYPQIVEGAYLEYDLLQNMNNLHDISRNKFDENPEIILGLTLRMLNIVTWDHSSQFTKLWANLSAMFDSNRVNEDWCSLKTQTLLMRSLTTLLMRTCMGVSASFPPSTCATYSVRTVTTVVC